MVVTVSMWDPDAATASVLSEFGLLVVVPAAASVGVPWQIGQVLPVLVGVWVCGVVVFSLLFLSGLLQT